MPQAGQCRQQCALAHKARWTAIACIVYLADTACDLTTPHHSSCCLRASCRANRFEQCRGSKQSPIMLPAAGAAAAALPKADAKSTFSYGNLTNAVIVNNGDTLQVAVPASFTADVQIPVLGAC